MLQFTQLSGDLYYYSDGGTSATATLYYLLPQGTTPPDGTTITFTDSWQTYQGAYLFVQTPVDSSSAPTLTAFMNAAWAYLAGRSQLGGRFVWFAASSGTGPWTPANNTIQVTLPAGQSSGQTFRQVTFGFQNVAVVVATNTTIGPNTDNSGFALTQTAGSQQIYVTGSSGVPIDTVGATLNIPFTGSFSGCLQFQFTANAAQQTELDVSLRYFYAVPSNPQFPNQPGNFTLNSLCYPIFSETSTLTLYANLDVLQPLNPARSLFAFNGADAGQSGTALPVASNYNSILGYAFNLLPQPGSMLVFSVNQQNITTSGQDPYTLVPSGLFTLQSTQPGPATPNLMCGLSGVEYVALTGATNSVQFVPGQAAFATGYSPGQNPGYLTLLPGSIPTTSFASITSNGAANLQYFAQPDQSVLYNVTPLPPGVTIPALGSVQVQAATISWPPATSSLFPLLPYSGLSAQTTLPLAPFQQMESQIASPLRRLALFAPGSPIPPVPPVIPSVTPQGLLVGYQEGTTEWATLVLGQMTQAVGGQQFMMSNVQGQLLAAFESNKLFLVISDPQSIQGSLGPDSAQILIGSDPSEAWTFNIDPTNCSTDPANCNWTRGDTPADNTIMIVKFSDLSIAALAGQTSTWAFPDTFNQSQTAAAVSQAIGSIISAAAASGDADFTTFNNAVTDPNWNGVLILNANAPLTSLPAQLEGLAAGINPSQFYAHHVGINASQIVVPASSTGTLTIANSSIFGLINYQGPPLTKSKSDYQFGVQQLKVLFLNSSVAGFSSAIQLQVNQLFSEPSTLDPPADNIVDMFGVYQKHVVNGKEQDSYTFQTPSGVSSTFNMKSHVLNAVQISQGQFATITSQSSKTLNQSQFVFWGLLDFKELDKFDVFSFGRATGGTVPIGLNFTKLAIDMSFDPEDTSGPNGQPKVTFTFDASEITFDLAASSPPRPGSFYNHFPLTLAGLTQGKQGVTPATLGYMGVQTPLNQSLVSYPWYSLNFNLNLGTPGALVAQVGFVATLTAGWSPNSRQYEVFTGLKLPGSSGSKQEISVEGIFDITFKTLAILATPDKNSYILILYGIGFEFLSFKFPPSGQVNFVLFGNPGSSTDTNLGWYAAYAKTGTGGGDSKSSQAVLAGTQPAGLLGTSEGGQ
jgi:hypothetical protein